MAGLGRAVGMSSGHLLSCFHSKDEPLLRTLERSEGRLGAERARLLTRAAPPTSASTAPSTWRSGCVARTGNTFSPM